MMLNYLRVLLLSAVASLAACGGGVDVDSDGNVVFTAYVTVAPAIITTPVTYVPMNTFPQSCIVRDNTDGSYILYGYSYAGCPQLFGYDLVTLFQSSFPNVYVDSWFYPAYGTVHIKIR